MMIPPSPLPASTPPSPPPELPVAHVFVLVLQTGVLVPAHGASVVHCTQLPLFAPEVAQICERQIVGPVSAVQVPSPFARPQVESFGSHVPLRQIPLAPEAFPLLQVPLPFGSPQMLSPAHTPLRQRSEAPPAHEAPPGIGDPVAAWGEHLLLTGSQYCCTRCSRHRRCTPLPVGRCRRPSRRAALADAWVL